MNIRWQRFFFMLKMYVANIEAAAILAMDFFRNYACVVDMRGTIWVNGQYHECLKTTDNSKGQGLEFSIFFRISVFFAG